MYSIQFCASFIEPSPVLIVIIGSLPIYSHHLDVIKWALSDDINRDKVRIVYENDEIGVEHSFVTFSDGNIQAVMAVFKFKDGQIISLETGATNMPK